MCGRTACTMEPDQIKKSCKYRDRNGNEKQPQWTTTSGKESRYWPSPNIGPSTTTPILVSPNKIAKHANVDCDEERVICEMKWGLIPSWHKGSEGSFKLVLNNCRSDTLLQKPAFKGPLERGQRCVVLAEGFFEWKITKNGQKQPYFLQFKDDEEGPATEEQNSEAKAQEVKPSDGESKGEEKQDQNSKPKENPNDEESKDARKEESDAKEPKEKRMLTMAGLYDKWIPADGEEPSYTYTIITTDASKSVDWLHNRMPAVLQNDDEVRQWLDHGEVPLTEAINLIRPTNSLKWYPVSTTVNNIRNKSAECLKEIQLTKEGVEKTASSNLMNAWVKRSPRKKAGETDGESKEPEAKKQKMDDK